MNLIGGIRRLDARRSDAAALAAEYVTLGALPATAQADALHVAVAVVHQIEVVVSWNLRHMVRLRTRRLVNAVNALRGHAPIEILTPPEL